ncbi:hypothetical protein H1R17_05695 [Flavobacterium sp. xlx-214]|uniref:hypothetical protein n=1 Tax=unclassified Flavobacterium TaxID=196869 RepID=UPI0013D5C62C|nr:MULTISPECIES: hypothetical protein [unclassified Flavobacterium]MBA5793056.1 hypothetical protein [Flavobacterium sp. xlx-221]QMI84616.1 hypothetical protein H1R17_05695 [Flavobacterium sp. xlx-214]
MRYILLITLFLGVTSLTYSQVNHNNKKEESSKEVFGRDKKMGFVKFSLSICINDDKEVLLPAYTKDNVTAIGAMEYVDEVCDEYEALGLNITAFDSVWTSYEELNKKEKTGIKKENL